MIEMNSLKRKQLEQNNFHFNDTNLNNGHAADKADVELIPIKGNSREDFI